MPADGGLRDRTSEQKSADGSWLRPLITLILMLGLSTVLQLLVIQSLFNSVRLHCFLIQWMHKNINDCIFQHIGLLGHGLSI